MSTHTIYNTINSILHSEPKKNEATLSRYPSTYARDFMRSHHEAFGLTMESHGDRGGAGNMIRSLAYQEGIHAEDLFIILADAYLEENNLTASVQDRIQAVLDERQYWRSLGYSSAEEVENAGPPISPKNL